MNLNLETRRRRRGRGQKKTKKKKAKTKEKKKEKLVIGLTFKIYFFCKLKDRYLHRSAKVGFNYYRIKELFFFLKYNEF